MTTATTQILDYPIVPRQVHKHTRAMIAQYAEVYHHHPLAFRAALNVHNRIKVQFAMWSDHKEALYRLWRGAVIAARHLNGDGHHISRGRDSYERSFNFYAYVWSEKGERYTVERWSVYPSNLREFTMWRCSCKDCQYRAPARDAAPTLDAPVVKYCKHIFAAAIYAAVSGEPPEPTPAATPPEPQPPIIRTRLRVLKAKERQRLQEQTFGRGYDLDEEQAKRRVVVQAVAKQRDRLNSRNGRRLVAKMSPAELANWERLYQESIQEAEELF